MMIEKMSESIFESTLPMTVEQFGTSPLINYPLTLNDEIRVEEDSFLADDHWKKFELDFPELSDIDDIFKELDNGGSFNSWQWTNEEAKEDVFLNHDCMWAGHCGSKEHSEEAKLLSCMAPPQPPIIKQEMCPPPPVNPKTSTNQQSLLKPSVKAMNSTFVPANMLQHTPQTPPESDDEENKASNSLLKILNDAINECDLDEDSDLTEYFEGKEVEVKEEPADDTEVVLVEKVDQEEEEEDEEEQEDTESDEPEQEQMDYEAFRLRTQMAAENDHSYYKDKDSAMMLHSNYGLDTPSDSEDDEEIDVVSVSEKYTNTARIALSMPTNPSSRDKHQLQRRVATAMSRQRINTGIKTILPVVRNPEPQPSKPTSNRRGVKRGRNGRNSGGYKRRRTANKVIEEHEPADKRHLHNDMERQRRVDLRIAFDNLKAVVPEVSGTKKIAKVNILLQASQYCYYLTGSNANYTKQLEDLKKKQVELRAKVSQLRRNLAANR